QIGLLEHGVSLDHAHRRPTGDLAQGTQISADLEEPDSKMVAPVMDAELVDPSFLTGCSMRRGQWVASSLAGIRERLAEPVQEHRSGIGPPLLCPDRQKGSCLRTFLSRFLRSNIPTL